MNIIDLLLSIFLVIGLVRGLFKGFFVELADLLSLLGGLYAAIHFSHISFDLLENLLPWDDRAISVLSFIVTFFIVAFLISLAGRFLTKMIQMIALGIVNRLLGGILGVLKMAFLASIFFMIFGRFGLFTPSDENIETSILYQPVRALAPMVLPTVIEEVKNGDIFDHPAEEETPFKEN